MAVIIDSSVLIDFLFDQASAVVKDAISRGDIVLSPLVIAEVLSGNLIPQQCEIIGGLLQDYPLHPTPLAHWLDVGNLRRRLRFHGINTNLPDAHLAQCALDLDATLLTRDEIFSRIAAHTTLHLGHLR